MTRRTTRRARRAIVLACVLLLVCASVAWGKQYPLASYELDQHVDAGLTNLSGTVDAIPHALAAIIWSLDRHAAGWVIDLFGAAFSVDLVSPGSALASAVARSSQQLYNALVRPLMGTMILISGIWALWHLLVMRRYADGAGRLALSLAYCVVALAIVLAPAKTIGVAAQASHDLSRAALGAALPGTSTQASTRSATDGLRASLIHQPWILLNFGAQTHCVTRSGATAPPARFQANGTPVPPAGGSCLSSSTLAPRFLGTDPGSDERKDAFDELNDGTRLQKAAVRIQTGSAGYDRVALALGLLIAATGAFILVGGLALGMIAAQLYALLLCACAPIALLGALVPGHGHHLFGVWIRQLIAAVFRSAVYCLYLALATSLSIALAKAAPAIGNIGALTLQAILWWGLVIYGRRLSERLAERAISTPAATAASGTATRIASSLPLPGRARTHEAAA